MTKASVAPATAIDLLLAKGGHLGAVAATALAVGPPFPRVEEPVLARDRLRGVQVRVTDTTAGFNYVSLTQLLRLMANCCRSR